VFPILIQVIYSSCQCYILLHKIILMLNWCTINISYYYQCVILIDQFDASLLNKSIICHKIILLMIYYILVLWDSLICGESLLENDSAGLDSKNSCSICLEWCASTQQNLKIKTKWMMHQKREACWCNTSDIHHSASHKHIWLLISFLQYP